MDEKGVLRQHNCPSVALTWEERGVEKPEGSR